MNKKIKVAFIGSGNMADKHMSAFSDINEVELVGIYSTNRDTSKELADKFLIKYIAESIDDLYQKQNPDILVIAVPELATRNVCIAAFKYDWTCLIEKPVGHSFLEALEIAKHSSAKGRRDYVALNRRFYESTKVALMELNASSAKRVIHVCDQEDLIAARKVNVPEAVIKNWMYANSIHIIDYLNIFGRGKVINVERICPWNADDPGYVLAKISYSSGDIGVYEAYWNVPAPWYVTVVVPELRLELRPLERLGVQRAGSRTVVSCELKSSWDKDFKPGLRAQAEAIVNAFKGKKNDLITLEDSLVTMELIHKIYAV